MSTQVYYRDPDGNMLPPITNFVRLAYARAECKVGWLTLDLEPSSINTALLRINARLEPWRQVGARSPYLDGESPFFLRKWGYKIDSSGRELLTLKAFDGNYLLDGRIVAYPSGDARSGGAIDYIDDQIKAIVSNNMGGGATDTARNLAAWLNIQIDFGAAPATTKEYSRRNVLMLLQDLVAESLQQGTYLAFDVVYSTPTMLELRTYTGQRGAYHGRASAQPVVISRERHTLEEPELIEDHEAEFNYVYAGGQDTKAARVVKTANTADALGLNRREKWIDARQSSTEAAVQSEANAALSANRYRRTLTGRIVDTDGCMDGVNYRYGDLLYAEYRGQGFDAHYNALSVIVENGTETRTTQIRGEA